MKRITNQLIRGGCLLVTAGCWLACAVSALAQGEVIFYNWTSTVKTHIYGPNVVNPALWQVGNGPNDTPAGTTDWSAAAGWVGLLGTGWTAQLWAAPGADMVQNSLMGCFPTTTFQTVPAGAGVLKNAGAVAIPGAPEGSIATLQVRVWDNQGGTITSWAMAQAAGSPSASSPVFNSQPLGLITTPVPELTGLVSFSFVWIPEPSSLAVSLLGTGLLCGTVALKRWAGRP